jgi:hypothetical protein
MSKLKQSVINFEKYYISSVYYDYIKPDMLHW